MALLLPLYSQQQDEVQAAETEMLQYGGVKESFSIMNSPQIQDVTRSLSILLLWWPLKHCLPPRVKAGWRTFSFHLASQMEGHSGARAHRLSEMTHVAVAPSSLHASLHLATPATEEIGSVISR